jgi:hypothetical protein
MAGLGGDTNGIPNDDVQYFAAFSTNGGNTWSTNAKVSDGTSNGPAAGGFNLGDYTGLEFHDGIIHMSWADNSNSTEDNPAGALMATDAYYERMAMGTSYLGIEVELEDAHLIGVPGLELWATGIVKLNKATDADGMAITPRMDWETATIDNDDDELLVDLHIAPEIQLQVTGSAAIDIAGILVAYTGMVELTIAETDVSDGDITLEDASVLSIDVNDAQVFAGVNGSLAEDHTGLDVAAINANGMGFLVNGADFRMVLATGAATDPDMEDRGDSYVGIEAALSDAQLLGIEGIELLSRAW